MRPFEFLAPSGVGRLVVDCIRNALQVLLKPFPAFHTVCLLAALVPFATSAPNTTSTRDFPGWPSHFEGKALHSLPLTALEKRFAAHFPGRIARFSDGRREIILRWVTEPTRKLHPAADCFRGSGYQIEPLPLDVDEHGQRWRRFLATRQDERLLVQERIWDERNEQWSDVSAWYWSAFWRESAGPWWAATVATVRR